MKTVRLAARPGAMVLGAVAVAGLAVALMAAPKPAEARGASVSVGIGVGPLLPPWGYYPPYPPHRHYAPPPVVYYAPPPVVYAQPPTVVYAQPPAMAVDPAGPAYVSGDGRQCREYQSRATVGGRPQTVHGTACLQPDGTWRIVN